MGNPKIGSRKLAITQIFIGLTLLLLLGLVSKWYFNRPVVTVSLPPGTEFPACPLEDAPECQKSPKCTAAAPGGLTYGKFHHPIGGFGKNWCCPDGTSAAVDHGNPPTFIICIVDRKP
jgi:hypothetical protein